MRASFRGKSLYILAAAAAAALSGQRAQAETWLSTSAGGDWNTPGNWTNNNVPDVAGESAVFTAGTANRVFNLSAPATIGSLQFDNPGSGSATTQITGQTLTFDQTPAGAGGTATISVVGNYGGTIGSGSNIHSILNGVVLNDNLIIDVAPRTADYSGIVLSFRGSATSSITGTGGITKNGLGTLVFADTQKSFTGPLTINQGRLRFNSSGGVNGTSAVTVNPGGQLLFEQVGNITLGTANTTVSLAGLGTVEPPTGSGGYLAGAIRTGAGLDQTLTNPVVLAQDAAINVLHAYNFTTNVLTTEGFLRLTNVVSGPGKLIVGELSGSPLQAGNLVVSNNNTYTGGTRIQWGKLIVSGPLADLGTGDVFVDGNTVQANAASSQFPTLANGRLTIQTGVLNAIADTATLTITGDTALFNGAPDGSPGGFVTLDTGVNEIVGGLVLGGVPQAPGIYGSSSSLAPAGNQFDAYFQGPGTVTVVPEPATTAVLALTAMGMLAATRRRRA